MDDSNGSPISENGEVLEGSVASAAAGGSGAHRSYGSTVAKLVQPMESKTPGSARSAQESDERWPALTNAQNLSYTLKVNEVKVWSGFKHLGAEYLGPPRASGGFGADFTQNSLLARPDLLHRTGDAIKMGETKFLAAPRGLDALGNRFGGKAGLRDRRDVENPFRLAASDEIARQRKHCTRRGVMKLFEFGADMGVSVSKREDSIEAQASQKTDPDGGPYPASPSGKSWEEASGKTGSGEKFYHKVISGAHFAAQPDFVTPVIRHCMGGLEIDEQFWVRIPSQSGEVAGGVLDNRLGGNSLLDCGFWSRGRRSMCQVRQGACWWKEG